MLPTLVVPFGFNCEEASAVGLPILEGFPALPPEFAPKSIPPAKPSPEFKELMSGVKLKPNALLSEPSVEDRCPELVSLLNSDCKASMADPVSSEPVMFKTDKVLGPEVEAPA